MYCFKPVIKNWRHIVINTTESFTKTTFTLDCTTGPFNTCRDWGGTFLSERTHCFLKHLFHHPEVFVLKPNIHCLECTTHIDHKCLTFYINVWGWCRYIHLRIWRSERWIHVSQSHWGTESITSLTSPCSACYLRLEPIYIVNLWIVLCMLSNSSDLSIFHCSVAARNIYCKWWNTDQKNIHQCLRETSHFHEAGKQ